MKNIAKYLLFLSIPFSCFVAPALAEGEITVEYDNGDIEVYSDVEISNTEDVVYFQSGDEEADSILMITKNECKKEGELLVCDKARVGLQSYGVLEEIEIEQIFLFINSTNTKQTINGSRVTMSPNSVMLEFATEAGGFVTGFGLIDSNDRPEMALK